MFQRDHGGKYERTTYRRTGRSCSLVSTDTVVRRFAKEGGVVDLGTPESPKRRRYRVLRS